MSTDVPVNRQQTTIYMRDPITDDNKYPAGTLIFAKVEPLVKLVIDAYKSRIYYCAVVGHHEKRQIAYFERELIDPHGAK